MQEKPDPDDMVERCTRGQQGDIAPDNEIREALHIGNRVEEPPTDWLLEKLKQLAIPMEPFGLDVVEVNPQPGEIA